MKPSGSALKAKQVKFALRRNLYHAQAGPVPPAFVRTPPHSRPKVSPQPSCYSVSYLCDAIHARGQTQFFF